MNCMTDEDSNQSGVHHCQVRVSRVNWVIVRTFIVVCCFFFQKNIFFKCSFMSTIRVSNGLDPGPI